VTLALKSPAVVLIVEDEALIRALGADVFSEAGFRVLEAGTGDEVLELLAAHAGIDVVFTDVHMRGSVDGIALAHTISEQWPNIGIIVVSGQMPTQAERLPKGTKVMRKPYAAEAAIRQALELIKPQPE
jgi:CheY-like chemotaxis protein